MPNPWELLSIVESYIKKGRVREVGVHSIDLVTGRTVLDYDSTAVFRPASTIKVPVACEVLRQAEEGIISLDQAVEPGKMVGGSGLLRLMSQDVKMKVSALLSLMLTVSDNSASNWLIDLIGYKNVNRLMSSYSLNQTYIGGKFFAGRKKRVNRTSARDLSMLMALVYRRKMVSPRASSRLLKILQFQQHTQMIQAGLPGWWVKSATKEGSLDDLRADVGLVWGKGYAYTLSIFDQGFKHFYWGESLIREISFGLFNAMGKWPKKK